MILRNMHDTNWRAKGEPERVFAVSSHEIEITITSLAFGQTTAVSLKPHLTTHNMNIQYLLTLEECRASRIPELTDSPHVPYFQCKNYMHMN